MKNIICLIDEFQNNIIEFDEIYNYFEKYITTLSLKFKLNLYINDLLIKLWLLCNKIKLINFKSTEQLDCYIKYSLKRTAINLYNTEKRQNRINFNSNIIELNSNIISNSLHFNDSNIIFDDLISNLTEQKKIIIKLRYKDGLSDSEIAKLINISRQAVYKNRLSALNSIKQTILI